MVSLVRKRQALSRNGTGKLPEPEGWRAVALGYSDAGPFTEKAVTRCRHGEPIIYNCHECDYQILKYLTGRYSDAELEEFDREVATGSVGPKWTASGSRIVHGSDVRESSGSPAD